MAIGCAFQGLRLSPCGVQHRRRHTNGLLSIRWPRSLSRPQRSTSHRNHLPWTRRQWNEHFISRGTAAFAQGAWAKEKAMLQWDTAGNPFASLEDSDAVKQIMKEWCNTTPEGAELVEKYKTQGSI